MLLISGSSLGILILKSFFFEEVHGVGLFFFFSVGWVRVFLCLGCFFFRFCDYFGVYLGFFLVVCLFFLHKTQSFILVTGIETVSMKTMSHCSFL